VSALERLASLAGIVPAYEDYWGAQRIVSAETTRALLEAMGYDPSGAAVERELARAEGAQRMLAASIVVRDAPLLRIACRLHDGTRVAWQLAREDGTSAEGASACEGGFFDLPAQPLGYHRLAIEAAGGSAQTTAIVAPPAAYLPSALERGRAWALATQLYGVRSERNWGIGDFSDLRSLVAAVAREGGGGIGLNPLHELHAHDPASASPYAASSRLFLNPLYVDVEAVPEFAASAQARAAAGSEACAGRIRALRATALVDYAGVAALKRELFELLYTEFSRTHRKGNTDRGRAFDAFVASGGRALERLARYQALAERFHAAGQGWGWQEWPPAYRSPESPEVERFAREHAGRVEFFLYLQWIADEQLASVANEAAALPCGLYRDLAVGADLNGADAWADQSAVLAGVALGAPPDPLNALGQNWGLPPFSPAALRERGYEPFARLLRANMRNAGALRIDHVMALRRCYWIPRGAKATEGAYVAYDLDAMLGVVALESVRNRCLVVGEDLGTVPEDLRERMREDRVFSTRLLYFQRDWSDGSFSPPASYPRRAATSAGSHDLPPLAGWWTGEDIAVRVTASLYPDERALREASEDRWAARFALVEALQRAGALDEGGAARLREDAGRNGSLAGAHELVPAVHRFLARTPSALLVAQLEDVLVEKDAVNVPGTVAEHPNWCRKRSATLEAIQRDGYLRELGATFAPEEVRS